MPVQIIFLADDWPTGYRVFFRFRGRTKLKYFLDDFREKFFHLRPFVPQWKNTTSGSCLWLACNSPSYPWWLHQEKFRVNVATWSIFLNNSRFTVFHHFVPKHGHITLACFPYLYLSLICVLVSKLSHYGKAICILFWIPVPNGQGPISLAL